jgi:uncharacterized Zn finger protein
MVPESSPPEPAPSPRDAPVRLRAAVLFCEQCGVDRPHAILRIDRTARAGSARLAGVARCRECRFTHRFDVALPQEVEVAEIVSEGRSSTRRLVRLPRGIRVQVGSDVPSSDRPLRVHRIETSDGRSTSTARTDEVATLWVTADTGAVVAVSIVEHGRTWSTRLTFSPEREIGVGDELRVEEVPVRIHSIRARGRTWRLVGDRFPAREVERIYGRRTVIPPAGRRAWSTSRGIPSSRTISTSRSDRSRSSPGVRRSRTTPRRRTESGGAAVQRVSPS